jgi:mono/diheme cytochrome c family protein
MRLLRRTGIVLVLVLAVLQLIPYGRDHGNPPIEAQPAWDNPRTAELFALACADCHSHTTEWPLYSHVAPVSWLVYHDVVEGREHFNIHKPPGERGEPEDAAHEVEDGEMPLAIYRAFHAGARLSPGEKADLVTGLKATFGTGDHPERDAY